MGIEWKVDGRTAPAGSLGREVVKALRQDLESQIKRKVSGMRCSKHGEAANVTFNERGGELGFEITGCCNEFVQQVHGSLT